MDAAFPYSPWDVIAQNSCYVKSSFFDLINQWLMAVLYPASRMVVIFMWP